MPTTAQVAHSAEPRARRPTRRLLVVLAGLTIGSWVTSAVVMASRGLDLTDESFYLLSYRWWDTNPRNFSGAQYLYGPLFEAFDYGVPALRLARLGLLAAAHGVFVLAFRDHLRQTARPPWSWSGSVMALVFASTGISYGWLPQAPGYNDVALIGSLLIGAVVLGSATAATRRDRPPLVLVVLAGGTLAAVALAKWSSALAVGALVVVVLGCLLRRTPARLLSVALAGALGVVLFAVLFSVLIAPWKDVLPPMQEVNGLVSGDTNAPVTLLRLYTTSTATVLAMAGLSAACALLPGLLICRLATNDGSRRTAMLRARVAAPPLASTVPWVASSMLPQGGASAAWTYTASLLAALIAALAATALARTRRAPAPEAVGGGRPDRWDRGTVLLLLAAMPVAQAFGTGNPLYLLAIHGLAFWLAGVLLVLADSGLQEEQWLGASVATTCAVLVAVVACSGLLVHPYRSDPVGEAAVGVPGSDNLRGVSLGRATASQLSALVAAMDMAPHDAPVYAVDELAGLVLASDRPPAGESWNSALDPDRSAAGLLAYCRSGPDLPPPVVVADRDLGPAELETLQTCGWPFYASYRSVTPRGGPEGVGVYIPDREEAAR